MLDGAVGLEEGGLSVLTTESYVKLESERVFFGAEYAGLVRAADPRVGAVSRLCSYFVNMIMKNESWVSYSTVTGFDWMEDLPFGRFIDSVTGLEIDGAIEDDEIIVTDDTAERLGIIPGDTVVLNYTLYDRAYRKTCVHRSFTVKYVVDIAGKADDPGLMPPFPGIRGKASCGDWDPPVPIDYSIMVGEDLDYWVRYGGTPKAYITLAAGSEMWGNDLGNLTTVRALPAGTSSPEELAGAISDGLNRTLSAERLGVTVEETKRDALNSVAGLEIVTQALLAFGSAITISGVVLIYVVLLSYVEGRRRELGILRSLGLTRRGVALVLTLEGLSLSIGAAAGGCLLGVLVAGLDPEAGTRRARTGLRSRRGWSG